MAKRKLYFWPNDQVRKSCAEILCVANNIVPDKLKVLAMHHQQSVKRSCSVLIIENHTVIDIRVDPSDIHNVTVPRGVLHIGRGWGDRGPFENCINLTSVTLPNTLTTIETGAFYKCSGLTSLSLPNTLTSIGHYVFGKCFGLTSLTLSNALTAIGIDVFSDCSGLTSLTLPNTLTTIEESAFARCSGLTSLTLPNTLTTIKHHAFSRCSGLTSLTLPNTLTTIEEYAFGRCSGLTSLTLPDTLTTVGAVAFWRCTALTSVVFQPPESRGALICWAVGNSHLVLRRLSGVLHHITTFALWSRDVSSVNADGTIFFGCDNLRLQ